MRAQRGGKNPLLARLSYSENQKKKCNLCGGCEDHDACAEFQRCT